MKLRMKLGITSKDCFGDLNDAAKLERVRNVYILSVTAIHYEIALSFSPDA